MASRCLPCSVKLPHASIPRFILELNPFKVMLLQEHRPSSAAAESVDHDELRLRALRVLDHLTHAGLYASQPIEDDDGHTLRYWRIGAEPFTVSPQEHGVLTGLGPVLHAFMQACNTLYLQSVAGRQPAWIAEYLDLGKPPELIAFSRMRR